MLAEAGLLGARAGGRCQSSDRNTRSWNRCGNIYFDWIPWRNTWKLKAEKSRSGQGPIDSDFQLKWMDPLRCWLGRYQTISCPVVISVRVLSMFACLSCLLGQVAEKDQVPRLRFPKHSLNVHTCCLHLPIFFLKSEHLKGRSGLSVGRNHFSVRN